MTVIVATAAIAAFAVIGGTGLAGGLAKPGQAQYGPGQYQYQGKVVICHKGWVTIRVALAAWPAHHRHGDTMGPCPAAAVKAGKLKAAKLKAAKLKAAKLKAKQHGKMTKAQKAAAKAEKHAKHAPAQNQESSAADDSGTSERSHGPPSGHGNGRSNGHANGHGKNG